MRSNRMDSLPVVRQASPLGGAFFVSKSYWAMTMEMTMSAHNMLVELIGIIRSFSDPLTEHGVEAITKVIDLMAEDLSGEEKRVRAIKIIAEFLSHEGTPEADRMISMIEKMIPANGKGFTLVDEQMMMHTIASATENFDEDVYYTNRLLMGMLHVNNHHITSAGSVDSHVFSGPIKDLKRYTEMERDLISAMVSHVIENNDPQDVNALCYMVYVKGLLTGWYAGSEGKDCLSYTTHTEKAL